MKKPNLEELLMEKGSDNMLGKFFEEINENTPEEMLRSEKFARGDRVNWLDPETGELKAGTLWMRNKVVWQANAEDPYDPGKDTDYWCWTIYGDDDHAYGFREEYLIKE